MTSSDSQLVDAVPQVIRKRAPQLVLELCQPCNGGYTNRIRLAIGPAKLLKPTENRNVSVRLPVKDDLRLRH